MGPRSLYHQGLHQRAGALVERRGIDEVVRHRPFSSCFVRLSVIESVPASPENAKAGNRHLDKTGEHPHWRRFVPACPRLGHGPNG